MPLSLNEKESYQASRANVRSGSGSRSGAARPDCAKADDSDCAEEKPDCLTTALWVRVQRMKTITSLLIGIAVLASGCSILTRKTQTVTPAKVRTEVTANQIPVPIIVTNVIAGVPTVVTNTIFATQYVTNTVVHPAVTNTVFVVNPQVTQGIAVAQSANTLNPTPTAPFITYGLLGFGALASFLASWQTKKANGQTALVSTLQSAVETFNGVGSLKDHVANISQITGTADKLHASVQDQFPSSVKPVSTAKPV